MAYNSFVLDEDKQWFLEEGRIDPITRSHYRMGDRVVVCDRCHMVSLESTWRDCGGCTSPGCGGKVTARRFLKAPTPRRDDGVLNHIILRNGGVGRQDEPRDDDGAPKMIVRVRHPHR